MRGFLLGAAAAAVAVAAGVLGWTALAGADPPIGTASSFATPTLASAPLGIAGGSDGNLWFTESAPSADRIGTATPAGVVSEPVGATGLSGPATITKGAAGTMWFTENRAVGEVGTATGIATASPTLQGGDIHAPRGVAVDSLGNVWATVLTSVDPQIEELAPPYTGPWKTAATLAREALPGSIATGPDGLTMWFTDQADQAVASITQTGAVTQYPLSDLGLSNTFTLGNLLVGPDGKLWVGIVPTPIITASAALGLGLAFGSTATTGNGDYLVQIDPSQADPANAMTAYQLPAMSNANPLVLGSGPDGELWLADGAAGSGALTAVGTDGAFSNPYPGVLPAGDAISSIAPDPGGADALWMTDERAAAVLRVQLQAPASSSSSTSSSTSSATTSTSTPPAASPAPPPTLTATLRPASAVTKEGSTLNGTISEPAASAATAASYHFEYGTSTAYGSSTGTASTTVTPAGASVSATLMGLEPYTTYHYRLLASDCTSPACQAASADATFTTGATLEPAIDTTVGALPTAGVILIELPSKHRFERLRAGELIPLGAIVDARKGTVLIESATGSGEQASGLFRGGIFAVTQPAGGTQTVLVLKSRLRGCPAVKSTKALLAHTASARAKHTEKRSHKVVNQVFGNAHGKFATKGNYATAADQGTSWQIADRCDGTLVTVTIGQVEVTDLVHHRTVLLRAGHHYLVHAR